MAVPKERLIDQPVHIQGRTGPGHESVLTPDALTFLAGLHRRFNGRRLALLAARRERQARYDAGALPDFRTDTAAIREGHWTVSRIPAALQDRRVEITGPVDRKMIINALNSGAKVFMADFEDSSAPTLANQLDGQINLRDAINGTRELVGTHGIYNFKPDNRYGSDDRSRVVVRLDKGQWKLVP